MLTKFGSHRPSHATVVAYLALFVALGGSSYAAITVTGKNIKDGTVTGKDVKNYSLAAKDLSKATVKSLRGQTGANGETGAAGAQGPKGDPGAPGAPGNPAPTDAIAGANVVDNSLTTADIAGIEENGTISLSGIPDGRCTQVIFNMAGAQVGETPVVTTGAPIQNGIVLYANRVVSDAHVEVNACNFTGGAMNPISDFPIRVVTFG